MQGIVEVLWRRRWFALAAIVLTVAGAVALGLRASPSYSYSSTVLLLPPELSRVQEPDTVDYTKGNPLFYLGSLTQSRDILINGLSARDIQSDLAKAYPTTAFAIEPDILSSTPVVVITATSSSDAEASAAAAQLTAMVPTELAQLQAGLGVEEDAQITSHDVLEDTTPEVSHKGQIRQALVGGAGLALLLMLAIGAIDGLLRARAARRSNADAPATEDEAVVAEPRAPIALRFESDAAAAGPRAVPYRLNRRR
ncbi:Wzz/FepE/Etk N-terminal domain-containing protein [Nocardioides sambongensis]|uniref:Wzz/FepE/Etk N-terminal domain-containing protein n=1 Tax=Nocardioides sambongensis TaxID=2589074 RepID=UPI00112781AB|nr:Wzz/FepE/Etk N-terminal domain-containing protein [Nocardioides sambongensis]